MCKEGHAEPTGGGLRERKKAKQGNLLRLDRKAKQRDPQFSTLAGTGELRINTDSTQR